MGAFLSNELVALRPVKRADLPQLAAWRNDPDIRHRCRETRPLTLADQKRWFTERVANPDGKHRMFVVTYDISEKTARLANAVAIGLVGLCYLDPIHRNAEVSFYIGDEAERGKGYCTAALRLLLDYGFGECGLHRIEAETFAFNEPGLKVLGKLGFVNEGPRRSAIWLGKQWHDSIRLGLLADEWKFTA